MKNNIKKFSFYPLNHQFTFIQQKNQQQQTRLTSAE